jgi:hypothetical protein
MRRGFLWASLVLASAVVAGIVLQLYFIAAWVFGASGALTAHKDAGSVVHALEVLTFVAGLVAWWRAWRNIAMSFGFALLGTIQLILVGDLKNPGSGWLHGLHGGLALFVAGLAVHIALREARALGLRGAAGAAAA